MIDDSITAYHSGGIAPATIFQIINTFVPIDYIYIYIYETVDFLNSSPKTHELGARSAIKFISMTNI